MVNMLYQYSKTRFSPSSSVGVVINSTTTGVFTPVFTEVVHPEKNKFINGRG